jgi:neutral ceramidase
MPLRAGFSEIDITPPLGTLKIGWKKVIVSDTVLDPLYARVAVFDSNERAAFVQLDTLSVRWTQVKEIRRRVAEENGFPGENIMVSATHNHAGPAVANCGDVKRDDAYVAEMVDRVVLAFGEALGSMEEVQLGFGNTFEFEVGFNRRVVMRDGTVRTHGVFTDPEALYLEGPIDPEVHVLAARKPGGDITGMIVNFACHPAHHGGGTELSGGFPGVLSNTMKSRGCPVTLFLDGASGNVTTVDPRQGGYNVPKEEAGRRLADDVSRVLEDLEFGGEVRIGRAAKTVHLPFREVTGEELEGRIRGAQRFIDSAIYDREMPRLVERMERMGKQPAEIQVIVIGNCAYAGMPAEYFSQLGLRIKEECYPVHALVVGQANGMIGYVPHRDAFRRGGYETTLCNSSRMAPEAGDLMADAAVELVRGMAGPA